MTNYDLENLRVLLVDDSANMLALLQEVLYALGIRQVRTADSATEAFTEMRRFPPDLIITDWNMQPVDGREFIRLVRTASDSPDPYVPMIILTGHTEASRVEEARDVGANAFLAKPVSAEALYKRVCAIIGNPRPFVKSPGYFGPDRRFRNPPFYNGPERRSTDQPQVVGADGRDLTRKEIQKLLMQEDKVH